MHHSASSTGRPAPACAGAARSAGVGGAAGRRAIMSIAHGALAGGEPHFSSNDAHLGRAQPLAVCVGRCASASNPPCNALRHLASPASPPADIAREAHVAWSRCRGGASTGPPSSASGGSVSLRDKSALAACVGVRCARVGEGGLGVFNPGKPRVYSPSVW